MVKSVVSMLVVIALLIAGAIFEYFFITKQFSDFNDVVEELYQKTDYQTAVEDDVLAVQKNWLERKEWLHVFIPHNEIKEVDLWLSEAIILVREQKWEDALSKIEVLKELTEQIPKTFVISIENIM